VRIVKELVVSGEGRGIGEGRNDEEFSPQRTRRAQRWGEEGERKETRLKVPTRSGQVDRGIFVTSDSELRVKRDEGG
jgi:hypothetical protein